MFSTIVNASASVGIAVGSILGGYLINKGRRHALIVINLMTIIGCALTIDLNIWTLYIGRFIVGVAAGMVVMAGPRMLEETVPQHLMSWFGCSTNIAIQLSIMIATITAIGISEYNLGFNKSWCVVYGLPIIWSIVSIVLLICKHKYESTILLVSRGELTDAKKLL